MRKVMLFIVPIIPMLSGCAGWVVFGHTIGQDRPTPTVQAAPPEQSAPAPTQAPTQAATQAPVQPAVASQPRAATGSTDAKLRAVTVALTPEAQQKIDADPRFSRDALLAAIHDGLRTHKLIDDNGDAQVDGTIEIVIDNFATRPASNAVVFGYVLSRATLAGNIKVRDAAGRELRAFEIKADSPLATPTTGGQAQSLGSLYHRFADLTVSELTGTAVPVEMPR